MLSTPRLPIFTSPSPPFNFDPNTCKIQVSNYFNDRKQERDAQHTNENHHFYQNRQSFQYCFLPLCMFQIPPNDLGGDRRRSHLPFLATELRRVWCSEVRVDFDGPAVGWTLKEIADSLEPVPPADTISKRTCHLFRLFFFCFFVF